LDAILSNSEMASSVLELRKRRCA